MSVLTTFRRLRGSVRTSAFEQDMDAELRHHLDLETEALVARGMTPDAARDSARRRFGSVALVKDDCRESWGMRAIDMLAQDVRFALRNLRKYPSYTAVVLLTLALGIGANTAIFSVVHAVLLRPLPYANGDRLVEIRQQAPKAGVANAGVSVKEINDYRAQTDALDAVVEYHQMSFNMLGRGEASRVQTGVVSANFFDVLGVTPLLGRTFRADDDDSKNAPAVLVLSYAYWQHALGGDPAIVGRTFELNDRIHTVIGVLPPIPQFPQSDPPDDVYMPPSACPFRSNPQTIETRNARMLTAIGRLKPGATLERAQNDLAVVISRLGAEYPDAYNTSNTGFQTSALSVHDELTRQARTTLLALLAVTGFVLLLVSANIANLALARVIGRERELALRSALGAGRGRIARQLLTESTLLAVAGGALGLLVGWLVRDLLVAFTARFTPRADEIAIDGVVLAFTFGVSLFTGLLFGLLPAFTRRTDASVQDAGHRTVGSRRLGARNALIVAQVAISFMLLVGAGLLVRSFIKLQQVDAGFRTDRVLTALVSLDFVKYATPVIRQTFYRSVLDKVAAEPGVEMAALGITAPLDQAAPFLTGFIVQGQAPDEKAVKRVDFKFASPNYFKTIGMTLLSGRSFTEADDATAPPVVIVNLSMARHNFPDLDPIGRRISLNNGRTWMTIVGLVNDTHDYGLNEKPTDEIYRAFAQTSPLGATLLLRTTADPASFGRRVAGLVHEVDARQPVSQIRTLEAIRSHSLAPPRLTAMLVSLFAAVALIITAAGIAGVVSFSVNQRTTEIGVRMALGAPRSSVVRMIVAQGLTPVTIGLACGLGGALLMTRVVVRLLFAVEPTDPVTYAAVITVLAAVAALACLVPARRAAAIDPMRALRAD